MHVDYPESRLMQKKVETKRYRILFLLLLSLCSYVPAYAAEKNETTNEKTSLPITENTIALKDRIINKIHVIRNNPNKFLTDDAIKSYIPFVEEAPFDPSKTKGLIKKLFELGFFENIQIRGNLINDNLIDIFIVLDEIPEVYDIEISGNKTISDQKLETELKLSELRAIDQRKLQTIVNKIRKLYSKKNFHLVDIESKIEFTENKKAIVIIKINENVKSLIKRVFFIGNKQVRSKKLKGFIPSREDWILGFVTKAGSYHPDQLDQDKRSLEYYYKTIGYLNARVTDTKVVMDPQTKQFTITFYIHEGNQFHIKDLHVQSTEQLSEHQLLNFLPMKSGDLFSMEHIRNSMEILKKVFGEYGYLFVDIQPSIVPDEENQTVDVSFNVDLGDKVYLNRLTIKGNNKTRDHIVRRKINFSEGDLLSYQKMELSKNRIEAMSFWDQHDGVQWKTNRINDNLADLDLIVKEAKTGKLMAQFGWGGNEMNMQSASEGFNFGVSASDINFLGKGLQFNTVFNWSKQEWALALDCTEPYLMDRPISVGYNVHVNKIQRSEEIESLDNLSERYVGGSFHAGYIMSKWAIDTVFRSVVGIENIKLNRKPAVRQDAWGNPGAAAYSRIVQQQFKAGTMCYINLEVGQDMRNRVLTPSAGFQWSVTSRVGLPSVNFGFWKLDLDYSWYTALIDEIGLVLGFHTHVGHINALQNKTIPFQELFNIGGPATVRGFEWGQISPSFNLNPWRDVDEIIGDRFTEPLGGRNAFFLNLELTFPIKRDNSVVGAFFYDGGSGWTLPRLNITQAECNTFICNANFDYRQAIGIGIRMLQPQNMKIDWGFKLDRRPGETASVVHFSTWREF
jgi:outer membrane protein insertion porin family